MHSSWILSRTEDINYVVPSWTGFIILIRNEMPILSSNIQYLTSIDSSATEMCTVITVLDHCLKIKEQLRLNYIVCVFDQAIYCKAMELKWRYPDKYKDCIVMLGIFHMIMMYLGIIGKNFSDAGLKDLLIQSDVVTTGSVDMYNRSVRAHKIVYEALYRCLLNRMENNTENHEFASTISDIQDKVTEFSEEITQISHDEFIESHCFEQFNNAVIDYKQYLESTSDLAKFWLSYLSMVELLLNTMYATRTGDWNLLLECVRDIPRYAFAYDNYNFARYLTPWLFEMLTLETSHPEVYREFKKGNFSVQLSETNPFGRCEPDRVIETTVHKDTKTPGGLTGFSTKTNAVDRWTINASYRASLYSHLQEFLGTNTKKYVHTDLQKSRIRNDQDDVTSMLSIIEECFIDPFSENPLLSISNGILATEKLVLDSFTDFKLGTERMDTFIKE